MDESTPVSIDCVESAIEQFLNGAGRRYASKPRQQMPWDEVWPEIIKCTSKHDIPEHSKAPSSSSGTILLYDSRVRNRGDWAHFLRMCGFYVETVRDGNSATERLAQYRYDVLLTSLILTQDPSFKRVLLSLAEQSKLKPPFVILEDSCALDETHGIKEIVFDNFRESPNPYHLVHMIGKAAYLSREVQQRRDY